MRMKTKLWKLLLQPAVCLPSLIVQWPARILHFGYGHDCETVVIVVAVVVVVAIIYRIRPENLVG